MNIINNSGEHNIPPHRRPVPARGKQKIVLISFIIALCAIMSGVTLALIFTDTDPVENTFTDSFVSCEVLENGSTTGNEFDGKVKTNVRIKNTGEVQSYIRASVVVTWMSKDGTKVTAQKPQEGTDYVIQYKAENPDGGWVKSSDGFWYCTSPVNVGDTTPVLIESCTLADGATPPDGFYLSVEIVASAIQSTPTSVVTENWYSLDANNNKIGVTGVSGTTLVIDGTTTVTE